MKQLWARIGMTITCTDAEHQRLEELMKTNEKAAQEFLWQLYYHKHEMAGDCYLPAGVDDNPNEIGDFEF